MAEKPTIDAARKTLEVTIEEYFKRRGQTANVLLLFNSWGRLQAMVVSDAAETAQRSDLRDDIWRHLRDSLSQDHLKYLYGIDLLTQSEYAGARVSDSQYPGGSAELTEVFGLPREAVDD